MRCPDWVALQHNPRPAEAMIATRSCAELEHVRQELLHECELILTGATAVDHLMIPSAVIVLHCRQLRTPRSTHMGYLVQTGLGHIVIIA